MRQHMDPEITIILRHFFRLAVVIGAQSKMTISGEILPIQVQHVKVLVQHDIIYHQQERATPQPILEHYQSS